MAEFELNNVCHAELLKLSKVRKGRKIWKRIVSAMAAVVVFCTTYAMILPAITMHTDPVCGMEEHEHGDECSKVMFICGEELSYDNLIHTHGGLCYSPEGDLICPLPEVIAHTHEDSCYGEKVEYLCELEAHVHQDDCYVISEAPVCGLLEQDPHIHEDNCYAEKELTCSEQETEGHIHGDSCYERQISRICGMEECDGHTHDDDCYETETVISCGLDEVEAHTHGESCYEVERTISCGLPEEEPHLHGDGCFETRQVAVCDLVEGEDHSHNESCFRSEQYLICRLPETQGHQHDDSCCQEKRHLVCTVTETEGHRHTSDCESKQQKLICLIEETDGHIHTQACDGEQEILVCMVEEQSGHIHSESCYERPLICGTEEVQGHVHGDECYRVLICTEEEEPLHNHDESCTQANLELQCGLEEIIPHTHDDTCVDADGNIVCQQTEYTEHVHQDPCAAQTMICEIPEHTHTETCYPAEETEPTEEGFLCGFGYHGHVQGCYGDDGLLICSIPEHTHTAACVVADFDLHADVESSADWDAMISGIELTADWPGNILRIAQSQLGYRESRRNVELQADGTLNGYSRYGAWYGSPYRDWCAMFASFCIDYAGVQNMPLESACEPWISKLQRVGYYRENTGYIPKNGDLIFFDWESDGISDHVGFVLQHDAASVVTIEGNSDGQVQQCTYQSDDPRIKGFGVVPTGDYVRMSYEGDDYVVVAEFGSDAHIPADALLVVSEILEGTEAYEQYYQQTLEALQGSADLENQREISFARFFDISFLVDGEHIEPSASVRISIHYEQAVPLGMGEDGVAVHFADTGVEVLPAETNEDEEGENTEADTFVFTQDSFSVTGTVVTESHSASFAAEDMNSARDILEVISDLKVLNAAGTGASFFVNGEDFAIELEGTVPSYMFSSNRSLTFYLRLDSILEMDSFTCSDSFASARINADSNMLIVTVDPVPSGYSYESIPFRLKVEGQVRSQSSGVSYVTIRWSQYAVYGQKQQFTAELPDGSVAVANVMVNNYIPDQYRLVLEPMDASGYLNNISNYISSQFNRREFEGAVMYRVYLQKRSDPNSTVQLPAPYDLTITYSDSPLQISGHGDATLLNMNNGSPNKPSAASVVKDGTGIVKAGISDQYSSLSQFAVVSYGGLAPGTTGAGYSLSYNEQKDAFILDSDYDLYFNKNSPIGTAGSFHIVAFDTANLDTHTNGNILAKNLYANSNFGTNNYDHELTYVQNYLKINSNSASKENHILVIGSDNVLGLYDNNNKYSINGTAIDRPKNIIQDRDTDTAPFVNLDRVEAEIRQISRNLVGYSDQNLQITFMDQKNVISLTDPDTVGILNVTPSDPAVFGKDYIQLSGFRKGHDGSIVINVDCTGVSTIDLPKALVVVDGQEQGTNEVTEFSNGKVLWNFINAEGVTINTHLMTGMVVAPGATVNIMQNLNGTVVADKINVKAESHRTDFTGKIIPKTGDDDHAVAIQKVRSGYVGTTLANAYFDLYIWSGRWQKVNDQPMVTDSKGLFWMSDLKVNTAYKLVETVAPPGYRLMEDPYYFWLQDSAGVSAPAIRPEGYVGYSVATGGVLNIPNEPDDRVETTQIEIEKIWDTDQPVHTKMIEVNLYQLVWQNGYQIQRNLFKTVTLSSMLEWKVTVTDLPLNGIDAEGNVMTYTYVAEEIPIEGYIASYSIDQALGVSEGTITITNRLESEEGYVLPETGGAGRQNYTFGGLLMLASAIMYINMYMRKRRREEVS